ncbi:PREDICTED: uncharacterized protein LOC104818293 isoform X2 [Tarenaya hassleriana]|uniref:uncharacterized protein LOC104818293 isoform X2 n=1 Tax=Tarenaya hassleriana TaxID=28532 RepID=UPI00053C9D1F|nr:PREDICTED: uncharacterized protein LOC104818293 isoform X2 [Tarenaya hassleriana]
MQDPGFNSAGRSQKRRRVFGKVLIRIRNFGTPLISGSSGLPLESVLIEPDRPYTIGRSDRLCDFVFRHGTISRKHCQILFDSQSRKLYISDGVITLTSASFSSSVDEFRRRLIGVDELEKGDEDLGSLESRVSLNGVYVNRVRVRKDTVQELWTGDEVLFVCGNEGLCLKQFRVGFVVQEIVFGERDASISEDRCRMVLASASSGHSRGTFSSGKRSKRVFALKEDGINSPVSGVSTLKHVGDLTRVNSLLSYCRHILDSDNPVSCLRLCVMSDPRKEECQSCCATKLLGSKVGLAAKNSEKCVEVSEKEQGLCDLRVSDECSNQLSGTTPEASNLIGKVEKFIVPRVAISDKARATFPNNGEKGNARSVDCADKDKSHQCSPPSSGKNFFLNRLQCNGQKFPGCQRVVSLPELFHPVENISQIFIATFTSDILWFLSFCEIPSHMPVTIACHNAERCWKSSLDARVSAPCPDYPNLSVVFPPFPEEIAFGGDRKKHGIACHHPKLFILQRVDSIRVVVTSANLVARQWNDVTNTIWWQDFPRRKNPVYLSLFGQHEGDAHWIIEFTKYDFEGAAGHLVASVPGIHSYRPSHLTDSFCLHPASHISQSYDEDFLGSVETSVVGLSYLFRAATDSMGAQLKRLASYLSRSRENSLGMLELVLRRNTNVPADANAVGILVPNPDDNSKDDCVQLGFLPKNVAKWVSPLWDIGFFRFVGYVYRDEVLGAASRRSNQKVQLTLHVLQGVSFSDMSKLIQPLHAVALCSLIASLQRCIGMWRLQEIVGRYKWPESQESDFTYSSSSIGGSVNAEFLAAFSSAAGKKALQNLDSQESDPGWGCWTASEERKAPSIRVCFPTIDRVKSSHEGVISSKRLLCFSEKTWQRLRHDNILHDAVPNPHDRIGYPMHIKVARRRFTSRTNSSSSFGWVYCGSHNFSAAAWGQTIHRSSRSKEDESYNGVRSSSSGLIKLRVCNYELGIVFVFPPPHDEETGSSHKNSERSELDDIVLPFAVPPPKYGPSDKPATGLAMREALAEVMEGSRSFDGAVEAMKEEEVAEEEEEEAGERGECVIIEEKEEEKTYAETLWRSHVDSSLSC